MMKAPIEYHSSAKVKIERRPKRSDSQLNTSVPMNRPVNSAATKLAKPLQVEQALGRRREDFRLEQPDGDIGGEEQVVKLEPAAERQQRYQFARVARRRQPIEPRRHRDRHIRRHLCPPGLSFARDFFRKPGSCRASAMVQIGMARIGIARSRPPRVYVTRASPDRRAPVVSHARDLHGRTGRFQ